MKSQTKSSKSSKSSSQSKLTSNTFGKWLRSIPQGSDKQVVLQPPVSLTQSQWAMLAVDAGRRGITLDQSLQRSINTFVDMVQDDLTRAA